MYENKQSTAHPFSHGDPHWWAVWQWPQLGMKCESEMERNGIQWPLVWDSQRKKERRKEEISTVSTARPLPKKREDPQPGTYQKVKSLSYSMVKKRSMQECYSGTYKNVQTGLWTYRIKCTKFYFFFISLHVTWLFYIAFNLLIFITCCFYIHSIISVL